MIRSIRIPLALAILGALSVGVTVVVAQKDKQAEQSRAYLHGYNLPSSGVALEGYCPVAYFAVNKPVRGKAEFASTYKGVTYH